MLEPGKEVASKAIYLEADRQGISPSSVRRGGKDLGVIITKKKDGWYWRLNEATAAPPRSKNDLF
jgi:hypothetical protein